MLHAPKCSVVLHMQTFSVLLHVQTCSVIVHTRAALSCGIRQSALICCISCLLHGLQHEKSTRIVHLQEVDVELEGLDWIVCHSGADIWHAQSDGEWNSDEQWENLIDFRCA